MSWQQPSMWVSVGNILGAYVALCLFETRGPAAMGRQVQLYRCALHSKDVHLGVGGHWNLARITLAQMCGAAAPGEKCAFSQSS